MLPRRCRCSSREEDAWWDWCSPRLYPWAALPEIELSCAASQQDVMIVERGVPAAHDVVQHVGGATVAGFVPFAHAQAEDGPGQQWPRGRASADHEGDQETVIQPGRVSFVREPDTTFFACRADANVVLIANVGVDLIVCRAADYGITQRVPLIAVGVPPGG
jgi:hypothetical protein